MKQADRSRRKPKIFYGYWILLVAFLGVFFMSGAGFYMFSFFIKPLAAEFGWSRGAIMVGVTIFFLVTAIASPFFGRAVDRYGARKVVALGALLAGLAFIWLGTMTSIWHFYIAWALVGIGIAGLGQIPATAVVSNWFVKRRGLAIGIISTGVGVGGFVFAALIGGYVIPTFTLRIGYFTAAALFFIIIIPLALFVLRTKPSEMGLHPDNADTDNIPTPLSSPGLSSSGVTLRAALVTLPFWLMNFSFFLHAFAETAIFQSQVPHLQDIGFSAVLAASIHGAFGIGSTIGKFGFGWLCDHIKAKYVCSIGLVLQIIGTLIILNIDSLSSEALIVFYGIIMGVGIGAYLPTQSILTSQYFGLKSYGAIFGTMTFFWFLGCSVSPMIAGYVYDATNSYSIPFTISLGAYVLSLIAILVLRPPKRITSPSE